MLNSGSREAGHRGRSRIPVKIALLSTVLVVTGIGALGASPSQAATGSATKAVSASTLKAVTLKAWVTDHSISTGDSFVIKGQLTRNSTGRENATIILKRRKSGSSTWHTVATKTTGTYGVVRFTVTTSSSGTYYYKLVHKAGNVYGLATSNHERITVSD